MTSEVNDAVSRARSAQPGWAALSFRERARFLRGLASRLREDKDLLRLVSLETGKPELEALGFELGYVLECTRYLSGRAGRRVLAESIGRPFVFPWKRTRVKHLPRGVVAVIGPWNFPLLNNYGDAIAPLLAGNAVILKPSPFTPSASLRVETLWREMGFPRDVFQVLPGDGRVGEALVDTCDMVFFTGSVASGKAVARRAAERLIPCVTELGGKSAMIVLEDADLDAAATAAVWGCFANAGQICIRPERILVLESVADDFVSRVLVKTMALHDQRSSITADIGPVMTSEQVGRAQAQLMDAVAMGASIRCGLDPRVVSNGRRILPTVVDHVSAACRLSQEETFAPILAVTRVRDTESALSLANDSDLGLAGYVFTRDAARGRQIARAMRVGSVCVNDVLVNYLCVNAPLGGYRQSGIGFRNGVAALLQFCHSQTVVEDRPFLEFLAPLVRRELAFPYKRRTIRLIRWLMSVLYR